MRDITLGQYYRADSVLHRLDPRTKLFGTMVYLVSLFVADNVTGYLLAALFLITMTALSRVPVTFMVRGLKPVLMLLLITMVFNVFFTPGHVIARLGPLTLTREGIAFAVMMGVRLSFLVTGSNIMTLTTTPSRLTDGMEAMMRPLTVIGVPAAELAMTMSIALRFIPILSEEADKIRKAQTARGADFESGGPLARAKGLLPLIVPLFLSAFRRAGDLALAMDARCYRGGKGRTRLNALRMETRDYIALAVLLTYLLLMIMTRRYL